MSRPEVNGNRSLPSSTGQSTGRRASDRVALTSAERNAQRAASRKRAERTGLLPIERWSIVCRKPDGSRLHLGADKVADLDVAAFAPIREPPSHADQRNRPCRYWASTIGRHIPCESQLERSIAQLLDFSPTVAALMSQPFELHHKTRPPYPVPDFVVRTHAGRLKVIDVTAGRFRQDKRRQARFGLMERACAAFRVDYEVMEEPDEVLAQNVRWLAGYKHRPADVHLYAQALVEAFAEPLPLWKGIAAVGEDHLVRPALFHLCWTHVLAFSVAEELTNSTLVWSVANPTAREKF